MALTLTQPTTLHSGADDALRIRRPAARILPEASVPAKPSMFRRGARAALGVPLYVKILVANALLVVIGAIAGTWGTSVVLGRASGTTTLELIGLFAIGGITVTAAVNAVVLKIALKPLHLLGDAARRVHDGDLDARAPRSALADKDLDTLAIQFNSMLDGLSTYRQRLRDVASRALNAEEEERKRIARELHDETAQSLAALLIRLRVARSEANPLARDALLEQVREQIAETLDGIRRYARGLRPPALDELGLAPAIESYARPLAEVSGFALDIAAQPIPVPIPANSELALYRILQESLSNVARHSGARRVRVSIAMRGHHVVAEVEDDGRGFSVTDATAEGRAGLGLFGMQERAAYVGGRVDIESQRGLGTRVRVEVPARDAACPACGG